MRPLLGVLTIGGLRLPFAAYPTLLAVAAVAAFALGVLIARRRGLPARKVAVLLAASAGAMLVGARLGHVALNPGLYAEQPDRLIAPEPSGFALYGGLLAAAVVGAVVARVLRLDSRRTADAIVLPVGLGIAVTRLGCFLNGCCFGEPTSAPWAITFPSGSPAHLSQLASGAVGFLASPLPVHPTQLYEATAALGAAVLASLLLRRARPGMAFLAFVAAFSAFRWFDMGFRVPAVTLTAPAWFYPALYGALVVWALGMTVRVAAVRR